MKTSSSNKANQHVALTAIVGILAIASVGCGCPPRTRQCFPCDAIGPGAGYCETSWSSLESCGPWNEVEMLHEDFYQPTNHSQVSYHQSIDEQPFNHPVDASERPKTAKDEEFPDEELPYEDLKVEYFP